MVNNRIRELRKSQNMSQEALAEVIHTTQQGSKQNGKSRL